MFGINKEDWDYFLSVSSIITGIWVVFPGGLFLSMVYITLLLFGGPQSSIYYFLIGLLVLAVGLVMIILPKKFNIRFLISSILCFIAASVYFIINFFTLQSLKKLYEPVPEHLNSNNFDESSSIQNVDFIFYENLLNFLVIFFIIIGIIFIIYYVKLNMKKSYN